MVKARKALLLAGASAFAILVGAAAVNAEISGRYDFVVPASGDYDLFAFGASGGTILSPVAVGGLGAAVDGRMFLTAGQHLILFAGGMGEDGADSAPGAAAALSSFSDKGRVICSSQRAAGAAPGILATGVQDWLDPGAVTTPTSLEGQAA